jgi:hypothetical protein
MKAVLTSAVTAALLAACGTTVPLTSTQSGALPDGGSGLGTGTTGATTPGGAGSTGGQQPLGTGSTSGGAAAGRTPTTSPTSATTGSSPQLPGQSARLVPGTTSTTVKIGVERIDTAALGAFASAVGANAAIGDLNAYQDALISWVNASGGLGGRKLTPVYFQADVSASNQQNDGARCATWAEDNRVYAAQAAVYQGGGATPCLAQHGVVSISTLETAPGSADDFKRYGPYYYAPGAMETVSLARSYVTGLHAAGFFKPSSKIGLLYFDFPEYRVAKERGLKPALSRHGLKVSSEYAIAYSGNPAELGGITAAVQNAELRFAAEGVQQVLFLDAGGTLALFFMQSAQSQHQAFQYGLNSTTDAAFLEGQSVSSELARATVAGTMPARDTNDMASAPRNPDRDRCLAILKAAGHTISSQVDRKAVFGYCSFYFFLKAAFDRASSYDPQGFAKAVAGLGRNPGTAAASNGDDFSPGAPWGATKYAIARWRTECSCFKYNGQAQPF